MRHSRVFAALVTFATLGATLSLAVVPARASLQFLGVNGGATTGRVAVAWSDGVASDSLVDTYRMTPDSLYAGVTLGASESRTLPDLGVALFAQSHATIAEAGPADSANAVADVTLLLWDSGLTGAPARHAQSTADLVLRFSSNQEQIHWAIVITPQGINPPPGPPGDYYLTHPVPWACTAVVGACDPFVTIGDAPNTGELDIGSVLEAVRAAGVEDQWSFTLDYKIYIAERPLTHFWAGVAPSGAMRVSLAAPRPNPARAGAVLDYSVASTGRASLALVDVAGRRVRTLVDGVVPAGARSVTWDGRDDQGHVLGAGIYFARLAVAGAVHTQRVVLVR